MGLKEVGKQFWKLIVAGIFGVIFLIGLLILLDHYGIIDTQLQIKGSEGAQKFWGWTLTISGLIFGVIPFLKIFKWLLKMAISSLFLVLFVFGICSALDYYTNLSIPFAHLDNNASWASILFIVIGLIFGLIPWVKGWKKLISKFKSNEKKSKKDKKDNDDKKDK